MLLCRCSGTSAVSGIYTRFGEFWRDTHAGVATWFALIGPVMVMLAVGGLGAAKASSEISNLKDQLDAVTLASARVIAEKSSAPEGEIAAEIDRVLAIHMTQMAAENQLYYPLSMTKTLDLKAKRVTVRLTGPLSFELLGAIGFAATQVDRSATAEARIETFPVCILALEQGSETALAFSGAGRVKAKDCVVWGNSQGYQAVRFEGAGKIESERLCVVGRAGAPGRYTVSPAAEEGCTAVSDPLRNWTAPAIGDCTDEDPAWREATTVHLNPGVYCAGLRVNAKNVFFEPGIYILKGPMVIRGQKKITGKGVGFYLTGAEAQLDLDGQGTVDLKGPESGPMSGIVVAFDRATTQRRRSTVTGRVDLKIGGVIYAPTQDMSYWGESDTRAASPVTTLIARTLEIGGDAYLEVRNDKEKARYAPIVEGGKFSVRLVN